MHLFIRSSLIYSSLICLTACGFEPMASNSTSSYRNDAMPSALAHVAIVADTPADKRLIGEEFRIRLEDLIRPGQSLQTADYTLTVSLNPITSPGLIAPDGKAQRYLVSLNSTYRLNNSDGRMIEQGNLSRNSSYSNLPNSYYSTYVAEQDTLKRLSQELAEQYRMKLASLLASPPKTPSELPKTAPPTLQTIDPTATFGLPGITP